jgi:molybdate transport system ATP-binding protein
MIQARISKTFASRPDSGAFTLDVDFRAGAGVSVLFGPSGSGKTLTLESIAGFVKPDAGRILLEDRVLFDSESRIWIPPRQRACGYVFQNYALFPHMTVRQNLEFALQSEPRAEREARVTRMLDQFRLGEMAGRKPHEISGGQQQRCSIARALIGQPRLLLLDEPAQGLDVPLRQELYEVLRQVRREFNTPVLLVTHDLAECFELGDEMFVIANGSIIQRGSPAEIVNVPADPQVTRLLGQFTVVEAEIAGQTGDLCLRTGNHLIPAPDSAAERAGERVTAYWNPAGLRAYPAGSRPPAGRCVPAVLSGYQEGPQTVRLSLGAPLSVVMTRAEFAPNRDNRDWIVEFPDGSVGVF